MYKAHCWLCIVPGTRESIKVENVVIAWNNNAVIRKNAIEGGHSGPPLRAGYRKHDFQLGTYDMKSELKSGNRVLILMMILICNSH